jgi:hypothetical protein
MSISFSSHGFVFNTYPQPHKSSQVTTLTVTPTTKLLEKDREEGIKIKMTRINYIWRWSVF